MRKRPIARENLYLSLGNIGHLDWMSACDRLGLVYTQSKGGTSHYVIRKPGTTGNQLNSKLTGFYKGMFKQANQEVFCDLLEHFEEDDIWKALKKL